MSKLYSQPLETLARILKAVAHMPEAEPSTLARYVGTNTQVITRALATLRYLAIVTQSGAGFVVADRSITRSTSSKVISASVRRAVLESRAFQEVADGLASGESLVDATRQAAVVSGIDEDTGIFEVLRDLALETGVLRKEGKAVKLSQDFEPEMIPLNGVVTDSDLESDAKAKLLLARLLGPPCLQYLHATDAALLASSLVEMPCSHEAAVDHAGKALEDFLRQLANDKGLHQQAKLCGGAIQLAEMLVHEDVIHPHQISLVAAPYTVRTTQAHKRDKKTMDPWELSDIGTFSAVLMAISAIRSIYEFAFSSMQVI